jgi:hypothetical protein
MQLEAHNRALLYMYIRVSMYTRTDKEIFGSWVRFGQPSSAWTRFVNRLHFMIGQVQLTVYLLGEYGFQ